MQPKNMCEHMTWIYNIELPQQNKAELKRV